MNVSWSKESATVTATGVQGSLILGISDHSEALGMEANPVGGVDQLWKKLICSSHCKPLLGKVKTVGQGCDFHRPSATIPDTPTCVFSPKACFRLTVVQTNIGKFYVYTKGKVPKKCIYIVVYKTVLYLFSFCIEPVKDCHFPCYVVSFFSS